MTMNGRYSGMTGECGMTELRLNESPYLQAVTTAFRHHRVQGISNMSEDFLLLLKLESCVFCETVAVPPAPPLDHVAGGQVWEEGQGAWDPRPKGVAGNGVLALLTQVRQQRC